MKSCLLSTTHARNPLHKILSRSKHTHTPAISPSDRGDRVRRELRALLRETAQPVAVITSLMPNQTGKLATSHQQSTHSLFHGATLSSFSSIAMDPHPLVAFSLRIPSRMATALKTAHHHNTGAEVPDCGPPSLPTHMVVNILSAHQVDVAVRFSRPDLHPRPFEHIDYRLSEEGLPVLLGSLGAMSCSLVAASWPLHDLESLNHECGRRSDREAAWGGEGVASELFIAQVTRVEDVDVDVEVHSGDGRTRTPLLYYRRGYTTTSDTHPLPNS